MEGKKQVGSSSSLPSDLFGKESSSSKGIFESVFPPPSKPVERDSSHSELMGTLRKQDSGSHCWNNKQGAPDHRAQSREGYNSSTPNKDSSSIYQNESVGLCSFSSSLYYGGQDIYSNSSSTRASSGSTPVYKEDGRDDSNEDLNSASRGNWWQGSLYY
ncbi:uncharacterized protein LOC122085750 [Macadamia integrifolia]|uniref:uncharacterized protein LOC122085750 n=1 Tax=Macadamia integrifolia TaxID=60698 RepID=UPI001C4F366D|nr:uncharacterized protein LOC122085750 [Macadamia integrifolia]